MAKTTRKTRIDVTIRDELLIKWLQAQFANRRFGSKRHAVEYAFTICSKLSEKELAEILQREPIKVKE
jgi:hypothetical protein